MPHRSVWSADTAETRTAAVPAESRVTVTSYAVQHCISDGLWRVPDHAADATLALLLHAGAVVEPSLVGMATTAAQQCLAHADTTPQWQVLAGSLIGVLELAFASLEDSDAAWAKRLPTGAGATLTQQLSHVASSLRAQKRVALAGSGKASKALAAMVGVLLRRLEAVEGNVAKALAAGGGAVAGAGAAAGAAAGSVCRRSAWWVQGCCARGVPVPRERCAQDRSATAPHRRRAVYMAGDGVARGTGA